jgi:hypothetical protein
MPLITLKSADNSAILLHQKDNVAVARVPLSPGQELRIGDRRVVALDPVPPGHKIALAAIAAGEAILRYGQVMGRATCPVEPGRHEIATVGGPCESEQRYQVEVTAGQRTTIRVESGCAPHICLQPCLEPPPPPPPSSLPRFGVGAGPLVELGLRRSNDVEPAAAFGARVEAFYAAPLGEETAIQLGVACLPVASTAGSWIGVGPDVAAVVTHRDCVLESA